MSTVQATAILGRSEAHSLADALSRTGWCYDFRGGFFWRLDPTPATIGFRAVGALAFVDADKPEAIATLGQHLAGEGATR